MAINCGWPTIHPNLGFEVSPEAVAQCQSIFAGDKNKSFRLMVEYANEAAHLTVSLDVIYHLIEDAIFSTYMGRLFDSSTMYVAIYSSNTDAQRRFQGAHIKHRRYSTWIEQQRPDWSLLAHIPNRYPYVSAAQLGSFADFHLYKRA